MKRSAALDFLRGSAAFAVAIPHYLTTNAPFEPVADAVAVAGVEVFFVLSGFVLAPQIVGWVIGKPWRNLGVFLARRWLRTIPPYVVALAIVAAMTGNLLTPDFLAYLFYVQNLFRAAVTTDFYPVAWSLSVEEWFYLLFTPCLFLVGRALGRSDRRMEVAFAVLVILAVSALRIVAAPHDWDLNVRRVTVFRIDSIVWGYLLYLALEKRGGPPVEALPGPMRSLSALGLLALLATAFELLVAARAVGGSPVARQVFPFSSALFGMASVGFFFAADPLFEGRLVRAVSLYLGRISYSAYLFHIIIVMALKPTIAGWPLIAQLALYLAIVCAFSTLFWRGFERPILARRPDYAIRARGAAGPSAVDCLAGPRAPARTSRLPTPPFAHRSRPCADRRRGARPQRLHGQRAARVLPDADRDDGPRHGARRADRAGGGRSRHCGAGHLPVRPRPAGGGCALPRLDRSADRRFGRCADLFLPRRAREPRRLRHVVVLLSQRMDPRRRRPRRDREARS